MFDALSNIQYAPSVTGSAEQNRNRRNASAQGNGDKLSISPEAYAAFAASRQSKVQKAASSSTEEDTAKSTTIGVDVGVAQEGKSLKDQLKAYIADPILAHALDQMEEAVQSMGLGPDTEKVVLEEVEAAFRSGIPAEGEQTTDTINTLMKEIKKLTGMEDEDISKLSAKITTIVEEAQRKYPQKNRDAAVGQIDEPE